jgi:hypothetical protein
MDPFVRKLVERMADAQRPLSRNKHFHTFESPEGQEALKIFKRLVALQKNIEKCVGSGGACRIEKNVKPGKALITLVSNEIRSKQTTTVDMSELELLQVLQTSSPR